MRNLRCPVLLISVLGLIVSGCGLFDNPTLIQPGGGEIEFCGRTSVVKVVAMLDDGVSILAVGNDEVHRPATYDSAKDTSAEFRTQTQIGWGRRCQSDNPGCYRDANFDGAFPGGLTVGADAVGCEGYSAYFTSPKAIENFLPQGGRPDSFDEDYTDPVGRTLAGVLVGQVVALTLNVDFDIYDPDFGASDVNLRDLIVDDSESPCYNMTVQEVVDEANRILGNCDSDFAPSEINWCVVRINENYADGKKDKGFLRLP
ncbi:MAG: hypothetical protein ACE5JA_06335 [bacterium]